MDSSVLLIKSVQRFLSSLDPLRVDIEEMTTGVEIAQQQLDEAIELVQDDDESTDDVREQLLEKIRKLQGSIRKARAALDE